MENVFDNTETLYRAVLPDNIYWKEPGKVSSAAFKDKNGLSTDRRGGRIDEECVECIKSRNDIRGSIISFMVLHCLDKCIYLKYDPLPDNQHHTLVLKSLTEYKLTQGQAHYLAENCKIEYLDTTA